MDKRKKEEEQVEVNFESHPPIDEDLDGIVSLLRQTLLNFADSNQIAKYLIGLKDVTQVVALEAPDEENTSEDDEADNNIYGVSSVIDLTVEKSDDSLEKEAKEQLSKFLKEKSAQIKTLLDTEENQIRLGFIINERYINLPPQLALSTLKDLSKHLEKSKFTHLVLISKILLKSKNTDNNVQACKKVKSDSSSSKDSEPIVYINAEEEIIFEDSESSTDIDVSSQCDENATWSIGTDTKYIPHRRIILLTYNKWSTIMKNLEKELN